MKNLTLFFIPVFMISVVSCKKEKEDILSNIPPSTEPAQQVREIDLPSWKEATMVGQLKQTNVQQSGPDTIYSYQRDGIAYIRYSNQEYTIKATDKFSNIGEDALHYHVAVYDANGKVVTYGSIYPYRYKHLGQWVTQQQVFIHGEFGSHTPEPPFTKVLENGYREVQ